MKYLEPHIIERIEAAQERARKLVDGEFDDEESAMMIMRWKICLDRGLGFFDPYFAERTLDDLAFEVEMIRLTKQTGTNRAHEVLTAAPTEEQDKLFDDWGAADDSEAEKQFQSDAEAFMKTGDFK